MRFPCRADETAWQKLSIRLVLLLMVGTLIHSGLAVQAAFVSVVGYTFLRLGYSLDIGYLYYRPGKKAERQPCLLGLYSIISNALRLLH